VCVCVSDDGEPVDQLRVQDGPDGLRLHALLPGDIYDIV
jgi:hypothetical protein